MSFFDALLLNTIFILFPIFLVLVIIAFFYNVNKEDKDILFDIGCYSSIYFIITYSKYYSSIISLLLLINVPFILAIIKKRNLASFLMSLIIAFFYNKVYNLNLYFVLLEYLSYYLVFTYLFKEKKFSKILYCFAFFKIFIVSFLIFYILPGKINFYYALGQLSIMIIVFLVVAFLSYFAINKGKKTISLNVALKELAREKELKLSLFKLTHEVKNPLAVCKGYLSMMDYDNIIKVKKYNNIIASEIDRTLDIMDNFSEYTKINIKKEKMDLDILLEDVANSLLPCCKNKNIKLVLERYKESFIDGDYNRLKQVFINVIKNSIESINSDNGLITINQREKKNNYIVTISDNGMGMSKEVLSHLNEVFFTTKKNGTGIGVALANEIIKLHTGTIKYNSLENKGTKVIINLPKYKNMSKKDKYLKNNCKNIEELR